MGQTKQGAFDMTYHHIEAPTVQDDEYGKQFRKRKLIVPTEGQDEAYRSPLLAYLAESLWVYSRKLDGENIRIQWDGEQALWNGKSNAFQCSTEFTDYMNRTFLEEIFEEKFKDWEGIVATPLVEMRDQGGYRVIVKIKNRDYLRD